MLIDVHAHYFPARALALAEADRSRYGVAVVRVAEGPRLSFAGGPLLPALPPALLELPERTPVLARLGMDGQLVSPRADLLGYRLPPAQGQAWCRLCNEVAADDAARAGGSFLACAQVPLQDPGAAAAELFHAVLHLGARAVAVGDTVNGRPLDELPLGPFWAAAAELGVPVLLHPAGPPAERAERLGILRTAAAPYATALAAIGLILGGVLERHPGLRFILAHGGGFLPWAWGRLEQGWHALPAARAGATRAPAAYLGQFWFDSLVHGQGALRLLAGWAGPERVLLGSGYPSDLADPDPVGTLGAAGLSGTGAAALLAPAHGRR